MKAQLELDGEDAWRAINAMRLRCRAENLAAVLAVADRNGELLCLLRLDGAPTSSVRIAANKAFSAARERKPSREIGTLARRPEGGFEMAYFGDGRFTGWGGGLPVILEGERVGAVAVSGLPEDLDEAIADVGLQAILASTNLF